MRKEGEMNKRKGKWDGWFWLGDVDKQRAKMITCILNGKYGGS